MRHADVIIIGAGMAGLSTAWHLRGKKSAIVLEGLDRIGGRIHTKHDFDGALVELGANWIQSAEWNPLKPIAADAGIRLLPWHFDDAAIFGFDDRVLPDEEKVEVGLQFAAAIAETELLSAERQIRRKPDIPLGEALRTVLKDADAEERRNVAGVAAFAVSDSLAAPIDGLSLYEWQDNTIGGLEDAIPLGGYDQVVQLLAKDADVVCNAEVQRIEHGASGVTVHTTAGVFTGDTAVITVSLGVLQHALRGEGMAFDPPLPEWKRRHIERLAMGREDKIFFKFPSSFWASAGKPNMLRMSAASGWGAWHDVSAAAGAPVLLALVSNDQADELEGKSDDEVIDSALPVLRRMFPDQTIPRPQVTRSRWTRDRFFRGAYSHAPVGSTPQDRLGLAEPVGNLLFAGEATNRWAQSSVHGAFISGHREAQRILTGSAPEEIPCVPPPEAHRPRAPFRIGSVSPASRRNGVA